ncbi:MAG TPA: dihydrodipicolinate synthase family protein, partial [Opitutae bacterium]|nr:dihydrodipicolinate synthase family protein [Opitutae bacterium]
RTTSEIVAGRLPVLISISDTALEESISLAKVAADSGADAVVLATPYYFPAGQTELIQYVQTIVPKLPLPVLLYNMPSLTKVWFEIETLKTLSDLKGVIGIKDSSGDLAYYEELCSLKNERLDWTFFIGPEEKMIRSISLGGDGGVNGGANIYPKLFVDAFNAARVGDEAQQSLLQEKIEAFGRIYEIGKYASRFIKGTKCAASILGLCDDRMAEPFNRFYPEDRDKVKRILDELDLEAWS